MGRCPAASGQKFITAKQLALGNAPKIHDLVNQIGPKREEDS
jgi:hypothetical protein